MIIVFYSDHEEAGTLRASDEGVGACLIPRVWLYLTVLAGIQDANQTVSEKPLCIRAGHFPLVPPATLLRGSLPQKSFKKPSTGVLGSRCHFQQAVSQACQRRL